jgi:hypothetical protein
MATPTPKADPLAGLTDILRDLFSTLSAPPPKLKAPKKMAASEPEEEEDDEDEDEDEMPMPMPPVGKGMRRLTISILMPAKGKKSLPLK